MPDLRALLDPLAAVMAARPKYRTVPAATYGPPPTVDDPNPSQVTVPAHTQLYTDPADMPNQTVDGTGVDIGAQLSLVQAALARFGDLTIRTVTGATTLAPAQALLWQPGTPQDVTVAWGSAPLAAVRGAVCRVDASVVASGRIQAVVLDNTVSNTGCTVRCTTAGAGPVTINSALPLTITATGLYLYWATYSG